MIRVVCDSSINVPDELLASLSIAEVPAIVNFSDGSLRNKIELSAEEFYRRLQTVRSWPTTAQPTPEHFLEAYRRCRQEGADELIVCTVTSRLSGTYDSAEIAAQQAAQEGLVVHVWDTLSISMGGGWQAVLAARMANAGKAAAEILPALERLRAQMPVFLTTSTLKYLALSGRMPKASALMGNLIAVKPVLQVIDGRLEPVGKVRGKKKAQLDMMRRVHEIVGDRPIRMAVAHANVPAEAATFYDQVKAQFNVVESWLLEIGPVLGTLGGPGILAMTGYAVDLENGA